MSIDDPFVQAICHTWATVDFFGQLLEQLQRGKPRPYRPLAKRTKTSGLAEAEFHWAEHHRRMDEARRAHVREARYSSKASTKNAESTFL